MTRARSIVAIFAGSLAWAAVTACNQTTINTPLRSFDRPSDVALSCVQYRPDENTSDDSRPHGTFEIHPLTDCEPVKALSLGVDSPYTLPVNYIPPIGPNQPFTPFILALVPQSARGELALVDTAQEKLIDADPYKPGYGFLPVGKLPEHIRSSTDGCYAVTANTDSCDLTKVDVSKVVHLSQLQLFPQDLAKGTIAATGVDEFPLTVPTTDASGMAAVKQLHVRPSWIEMAPPNDSGGTPSTHGYEDGGTPGQCTGGQHRVWVALPACQLVVKVLLEADPTSKTVPTIEQALHVDKSGVTVVSDLSTIECPVECTGGADTSTVDAGALVAPVPNDMGVNLPTSQAWPAALAIDVETDVLGAQSTGRLIIGDGYGERIDIVPFNVTAATYGTPRSITLDPGTNTLPQPGVRVVRAGPRSQAGKFLYVVARDATVRVIDLDREVECETNPDPRWDANGINLQQTPTSTPPLPADSAPQARSLGCFPLGDPSTPRRSPLATTPGITLVQGQLPTDVAFVHIDSPPGDPSGVSVPPPAAPGLMVGDFAWIISSDGRATAINIFDACPAPNQQDANATPGTYTSSCILGNIPISLAETVSQFGHPQPMLLDRISHRIRAGHPRFFLPAAESDDTGTPRVVDSTNPCAVAVPPTSPGVPDGGVPDAGGCGSTEGNLPSLLPEPVPAALAPQPNETRVVYFTDPDHARNETWVMVWEGVLSGTSRSLGSPFVVPDTSNPPQTVAAYLSDVGGSWCSRGVLKGDKMLLRGCTVDAECDQSAFYQCVHDPGAFTDVTQGMCLPIDNLKNLTTEYWSDTCGKLLRSQRKFRVLHARQAQPVPNGFGATSDLLTVGEIYEPEYSEETTTCTTDAECANITVAAQVGGGSQQTFCLPDNDGNKRCILPCADVTKDDSCGIDFECAVSTFGDKRCMRAPIGDANYWHTCMPELQEYEIHVGDTYSIAGTTSGFLSNEVQDPSGECIVPPVTMENIRLSQWRIPMSAPACPANVNADPLAQSIDPALQTNICEVAPASGSTVKLVHFENPIFNIVAQFPLGLNGRPIVPPDDTSVSMAVTGGGNNLVAQIGVDVQAQQPRYATVAPDGQTVYIIDEGKSPAATGLRGQLLRLFSSSQSVDNTFIVR